jgi:hypothetical protein
MLNSLVIHGIHPKVMRQLGPAILSLRPASTSRIIVQMGDTGTTPQVMAYSFSENDGRGAPLPSCVFTAATYTNPDPTTQALGRALLSPRDAIVLIPRAPLKPGSSYAVSLKVDWEIYSWTFDVAPLP